jgi:hypothetical protein
VSQDQKDRLEQQVAQAESDIPATPLSDPEASDSEVSEPRLEQDAQGVEATAATPAKRRAKRKTRLVNVAEISPRPSYWPLALAFSLAVVLFGVVSSPIVIAFGVLLVIGTAIGWIFERR